MNRLRVKLYAPFVTASAAPRFAVRAAHFLGEYCDRTPGLELTVTASTADRAGRKLPWPVARFMPIAEEQLAKDPNGVANYEQLFAVGMPAFEALFLPDPWPSFPAGRLAPNGAPLIAYVPHCDFDDTDLGSVTDTHCERAKFLVRDCAALAFPSEGLRQHMIRCYGLSPERAFVVSPAASITEVPRDAEALTNELNLPGEYVVCFEAAGRDAEEELGKIARHTELPMPIVILGDASEIARRDLSSPAGGHDGQPSNLIRLKSLTDEQYRAVLARSSGVVAFTSSSVPFFDSHHLDGMVLRKPLLVEAPENGVSWEGVPANCVTSFSSFEQLIEQLRKLRSGHLDTSGLDEAERIARSRSENDQAGELFEVIRAVCDRPFRDKIRFRTAEPVCRERRVAWLCNHAALHAHEVPLLRSFGLEVYTPKRIPSKGCRSGAVSGVDDEWSTLPRWVLERLNRHNFYEDPLPEDIVPILNGYFGTVIVSSYGMMVKETVLKFRGRIMVRAFGREHPRNYSEYWNEFGGKAFWDRLSEIRYRFWLTAPYDTIASYEPEPLRSMSLTVPLGIADRVMRNGGQWNGECEKVLFVCPSINDSPQYYGKIYREFMFHFGDLPHLIAGSQKKPVDDPNVLGYLLEVPYRRLLNDMRVMYYHSREPRHLHYHPLEAIVQGMPVVYLKGGLMEDFGGPDQPGACDTEADARRLLKRVLGGDQDLIAEIREQQTKILETFLDDYVRREWQEKFIGEILNTPLTPGARPIGAWLDAPVPAAPKAASLPRPDASDLKVGVYLRTVRGGGVFNYATTLAKKLAESNSVGRLEVMLGRRLRETPFPNWPFDQPAGLKVHHLGDREYLPGVLFPREQPSYVNLPDAPTLEKRTTAPAPPVVLDNSTWRRRVKNRLRPMMTQLRETRASHRVPSVRTGAAWLLAAMAYGRGVLSQKTLKPKGTGAARLLKFATDPDPAALTYEQIREIAARNEVTFFAYPFDSVAADVPLEKVEELPVVVVMYDLAHEYTMSWQSRNYTIHREMHVWAKLAKMIVFGSDSIRRDAVRRYGIPIEKTAVITVPPLVPRQEPPSSEEVADVRRRLRLPQNYVLNLGYQGPHKNNVVLLEAIGLMKWRGEQAPPLVLAGPDARRFVVGDLGDAYSVKVREVIAKRKLVEGRDFFVLDYIAQEDIVGLYGGAAACVSLSRSEAQIHGMILEAMLYKRPLVCSDIPCNVEQLGTADDKALLVPPDDPAAVADALAEILRNPHAAQERVNEAHAWIRSFSWEPVLAEYRRVFAVAAGRDAASTQDLAAA